MPRLLPQLAPCLKEVKGALRAPLSPWPQKRWKPMPLLPVPRLKEVLPKTRR